MDKEPKEPILRYFCIYNPDFDVLGENLEKQIVLYYPPQEACTSEQLRHIGVAQGVVELSKEFSNGVPCHTLETQETRLVIKELEDPNWWVLACLGTAVKSSLLPEELFTMSIPELLIAQIEDGYRRWRLHHGRFQDIMARSSKQELIEKLEPWWFAWCKNWQVTFHHQGVIGLFNNYIRLAKGQLLPEISEVVQNVVDKEEAMIDMIVTGNSPDPENNGCLWYSKNKDHNGLSPQSITDIVKWVEDCYECHNDGSFLEPSGFVYHLKRAGRSNTKESNDSKSSLSSPLATMGTAISNATIDSVNHFMELVNLRAFSKGRETSVHEDRPADELADSRFLIGLMGDNLETESDGDPQITKKSVFIKREESNEFMPVNLVIYRRRPFTFILLYKHQADVLDNKQYYTTLHLRLASLSEPFLLDFRDNFQSKPKFYYIVVDPSTHSIQSSLPLIPDLPRQELMEHQDSSVDRAIQARLEMIHVHHHLSQIWIDSDSVEQEKFVRTSRNWWIYLTRLPDDRKVLFARKWSKQGKPPGHSSSLLGALGRDAKLWLDEYKFYGKV